MQKRSTTEDSRTIASDLYVKVFTNKNEERKRNVDIFEETKIFPHKFYNLQISGKATKTKLSEVNRKRRRSAEKKRKRLS